MTIEVAETTTPTGVPIRFCDTCKHLHPVTRQHCPVCGSASLFCHSRELVTQ